MTACMVDLFTLKPYWRLLNRWCFSMNLWRLLRTVFPEFQNCESREMGLHLVNYSLLPILKFLIWLVKILVIKASMQIYANGVVLSEDLDFAMISRISLLCKHLINMELGVRVMYFFNLFFHLSPLGLLIFGPRIDCKRLLRLCLLSLLFTPNYDTLSFGLIWNYTFFGLGNKNDSVYYDFLSPNFQTCWALLCKTWTLSSEMDNCVLYVFVHSSLASSLGINIVLCHFNTGHIVKLCFIKLIIYNKVRV